VGIEKFQVAEFDEGDVPAGELQLQQSAVTAGAKKHNTLYPQGRFWR